MRRNGSVRPYAFLGVLAALSGTGCYIMMAPPMAPAPRAVAERDGPPGAAALQSQGFALGASAGIFTTLDSEAVNGLSEGVMWNVQVSLRLSEIMALQFDYGSANLDDSDSPLGGDMTIAPAMAAVVFSVPDMWMQRDMVRYLFGIGGGVAKLDHSEYEVEEISVFRMLFGVEWLLQENGRLFAVADIMIGEEVDDASASWWWDLSTMSAFRVGLEFGF